GIRPYRLTASQSAKNTNPLAVRTNNQPNSTTIQSRMLPVTVPKLSVAARPHTTIAATSAAATPKTTLSVCGGCAADSATAGAPAPETASISSDPGRSPGTFMPTNLASFGRLRSGIAEPEKIVTSRTRHAYSARTGGSAGQPARRAAETNSRISSSDIPSALTSVTYSLVERWARVRVGSPVSATNVPARPRASSTPSFSSSR